MIVEIERFIATVDRGSFTRASQMLYLTQPALSLSIARLEKEVGARLFKRIGKRLVLTEEGESAYQIGTQIIKLWGKIKDSKKNNFAGVPYSIGIYDNAALKLSKYFRKSLSREGVKFEIVIDTSSSLMKSLRNGLLDICICVIRENVFGDNFKLIKKFSEELVPVSSKIWQKKSHKTPFILYNKESATRQYIDKTFVGNRMSPLIIVESTSTMFMKELAIGGCGIALLPLNVVEKEIENRKLFINKFPFKFKREFGLYLSQDGRIGETDGMVKEIIKNLR